MWEPKITKKTAAGLMVLAALSAVWNPAQVLADTSGGYSGYYEDDFADDAGGVLSGTSKGEYQDRLVETIAEYAQPYFMEKNTKILPSVVAAEAMYISQNGNSELAAKYRNYFNIPYALEYQENGTTYVLRFYSKFSGIESTDYIDVDAWTVDEDGEWYQETGRWVTFDSISQCIDGWYTWLDLGKGDNTLQQAAFTDISKTNEMSAAEIISSAQGYAESSAAKLADGNEDEEEELVSTISSKYSLWKYDIPVLLSSMARYQADKAMSEAETLLEDTFNASQTSTGRTYTVSSTAGTANAKAVAALTWTKLAMDTSESNTSTLARTCADTASIRLAEAKEALIEVKSAYEDGIEIITRLENLLNQDWLGGSETSTATADYKAYATEETAKYVKDILGTIDDEGTIRDYVNLLKKAYDDISAKITAAEAEIALAYEYADDLEMVETAESALVNVEYYWGKIPDCASYLSSNIYSASSRAHYVSSYLDTAHEYLLHGIYTSALTYLDNARETYDNVCSNLDDAKYYRNLISVYDSNIGQLYEKINGCSTSGQFSNLETRLENAKSQAYSYYYGSSSNSLLAGADVDDVKGSQEYAASAESTISEFTKDGGAYANMVEAYEDETTGYRNLFNTAKALEEQYEKTHSN